MLVWRYKAKPNEYPEFQARLRHLAEQAGVRTPTLIVMRGAGRVLNAAATQSILSGPKVIVVGDILETLTDAEKEYVTAHELSHIRHLDILAGVLIGAGNSAIAIQKWAIVTSLAYDLFAYGWRAFVYLAGTWVVLWVTHGLYKLLAAAHSRSREYLADVGAVQIAGWEGRVALITGLARINHANAVALAGALAKVKGVEVLNDTFFNEFTIRVPGDAAEVIEKLARKGVLGGVPASRLSPDNADLRDLIIVASTEVNTDEDRAAYVKALKAVLK